MDEEKSLNTPRMLTLEMTLRCNQQCSHCYNNSGPEMGSPNDLTRDEYLKLVREGTAAGFTGLQLSGGEPNLNPALPEIILAAKGLQVELYSNLSILPQPVLEALVATGASAATSFYSDRAEVHHAIIGDKGNGKNWYNTVRNIRRILEAKIPFRAGVIVMNENSDRIPQTIEFLKSIGVKKIDVAHVQGVGRAEEEYPVNDPKDGLCGQCCYGSLTVSPQGDVFPCSIGRAFIVGNVRKNSLTEIANSETIRTLRRELKEYFTAKRMSGSSIHMSKRDPNDCSPNRHSYRLVDGVTVDYITGCSSGCDPDHGPCTPRDCCRPKGGFTPSVDDRSGCGPEVLALGDVEVTYGCECSPSWCSPRSKPCSPKADFKAKSYETQRKRGL